MQPLPPLSHPHLPQKNNPDEPSLLPAPGRRICPSSVSAQVLFLLLSLLLTRCSLGGRAISCRPSLRTISALARLSAPEPRPPSLALAHRGTPSRPPPPPAPPSPAARALFARPWTDTLPLGTDAWGQTSCLNRSGTCCVPGFGLVSGCRGLENHPRPDAPTRGGRLRSGRPGQGRSRGEAEREARDGEERAFPGGMRSRKLPGAKRDRTGGPAFRRDPAASARANSPQGRPHFYRRS